MTRKKGFLMVTMDPPPGLEDEFNDWYDMEHIPDRAAIPGFESARRFVCVSGWPKYLAFYDLAAPDVLESEPYRRLSWGNFSPWTKRMVAKVRGQYRGSGEQVYPGDALMPELSRLLLIRFRNLPDAEAPALIEGLRRCYEGRPETRQLRVLRSDYDQQIDYMALVAARVPFTDARPDPTLLGPAADHIDIVNEYAPYWLRGRLAGVFANN